MDPCPGRSTPMTEQKRPQCRRMSSQRGRGRASACSIHQKWKQSNAPASSPQVERNSTKAAAPQFLFRHWLPCMLHFDGASHLRYSLPDRMGCRPIVCGLQLDPAWLPRTPFCGTGRRSAWRPLCDELPASGDYLCENALRGRTSRRGQRRRKSTSAVRVGKVRA